MKFQDLPVSVQEVAAKTLSEMMLCPDNKKEPAELAQGVCNAFVELYGAPEKKSGNITVVMGIPDKS